MIDPSDIRALLESEPFASFRVCMSGGEFYDVVDASLAVAMENSLFMALPKRDRWKLLSYQNMMSIELPAPCALHSPRLPANDADLAEHEAVLFSEWPHSAMRNSSLMD
jgi:hypothetical protein